MALDLDDWQKWWKHFGRVELRHLLLLYWDPVGVYGAPEAKDEYDHYAGQVAQMLREGCTTEEIATFLERVETHNMGLPPKARTGPQLEQVAERLAAWFADAMKRLGDHASPP